MQDSAAEMIAEAIRGMCFCFIDMVVKKAGFRGKREREPLISRRSAGSVRGHPRQVLCQGMLVFAVVHIT